MFHSRYLWLWLLTPDGVLVEVNRTALEAAEVTRDAVVWKSVWETPWFEGDATLRGQLRQAVGLAAAGEEMRYVSDVYARGGLRRLDLNLRPYVEPGGAITLLILEASDRTEMRTLERKVEVHTQEREDVLAAVGDAVMVHEPDLAVRYANAAARGLFGSLVDTRRGPALPPLHDAEGRILAQSAHPAVQVLREGMSVAETTVGVPQRDTTTWYRVHARPLQRPDTSGPHGAVVVYRPVALDAAAEDAPALTGRATGRPSVADRPTFMAHLTHALARVRDHGLLLVDGSAAAGSTRGGDTAEAESWRRITDALARSLRPDDRVGDVGGGHLALLLPRVGGDDDVRAVAMRIEREWAEAAEGADEMEPAPISMGWALQRPDSDGEALLRQARTALAHARQRGQPCGFSEPGEDASPAAASLVVQELDRALEEEQFDAFFQPLVDAKSHAVVGAEALMRWRHPERGLVSPAEFIPAAEDSGRIVDMERWLWGHTMRHLRSWNRNRSPMRLSLNLSARQLERPDFIEDFATTIAANGVSPSSLIVEVTETFAMQHPTEAARVLHGLAELGVALAIDDFGTGYSNLGQLQHLPFEIVKIDRGFLRDVPENQRNFALVRTIIAMAQSLDLTIIAEGVETKTQADFLYWEGATWLQGFHFGRPMPAATFASMAVGGNLPFEG